jgi:hypothetical protein
MARVELDTEERGTKWDKIKFDDVYQRLYNAKIVSSQTELARLLKLGRAAISYVSKKEYVPREWKLRFERAGYSWEWVAYGEGGKFNSNYLMTTGSIVTTARIIDFKDDEVVYSQDAYEYPLHKTFLTQLNIQSDKLGYIVQSGNSMQPIASDGDIWIVDLDNNTLDIGNTYLIKAGKAVTLSLRTVTGIDGINNNVTLGYGNTALQKQTVDISLIHVVGHCVLKVCKAV